MFEIVSTVVTTLGLIGLIAMPILGLIAMVAFIQGYAEEKERIKRLTLRDPWERECDEWVGGE